MRVILLLAILLLPMTALTQPSDLVTIRTEAKLTDTEGRSVAAARQHRMIVDAPPPLGGPNEEVNPIEATVRVAEP